MVSSFNQLKGTSLSKLWFSDVVNLHPYAAAEAEASAEAATLRRVLAGNRTALAQIASAADANLTALAAALGGPGGKARYRLTPSGHFTN